MHHLPIYQTIQINVKMKPYIILQNITILLLFFLSGHELQAQGNYVNADSLCKIATSMNTDSGIRFLTDIAAKCNNASNRDECSFKLFFTAGYLSQKNMLRSQGEEHDKYAEYAMQFYNEALRNKPASVPALTNIYFLYRSLNNYQQALTTLDKLIEVDSENEGRYLLNKAEIYNETGDHLSAAICYRKAFFADRSETMCLNAFNAYNDVASFQDFYTGMNSFIEELTGHREYDLARKGYLAVLKKAISANDQSIAGEACIGWLDALILTPERINSSIVNELPDTITWGSECNFQLHKMFSDPLSFFTSQRNKSFSLKERHIIATVLLGLESGYVMQGDIKYAVKLLEEAFRAAPWFYRYHSDELKDLHPVQTNIALELARLYTNYPEFDPDKSKFNTLIRELFNEKAVHYRQNDLEAIQRSHTVLGLIYAERNVWNSNWYAGNAIFQLEHAIKVQQELEKKDPSKYKPVPSLYQTLAKGYDITGQKKEEATALINAAKDYLDIDYIDASERYVKQARNIQMLTPEQTTLLRALNSIIDIRSDILNNRLNFREDPAVLEQTISRSVLFADSVKISDNSFLNRQRFKILSDIGQRVSEVNPDYTYPLFEVKALEYLKREKTLSSHQDIERINHIEKTFRPNLEDKNIIKVTPNTGIINKSGNAKDLHLNSGSSNTTIEVNNDLFIIGRLYETVPMQNRNSQGLKKIKVRRGHVMIHEAETEQQTIDENRTQKINEERRGRSRTIPEKR